MVSEATPSHTEIKRAAGVKLVLDWMRDIQDEPSDAVVAQESRELADCLRVLWEGVTHD